MLDVETASSDHTLSPSSRSTRSDDDDYFGEDHYGKKPLRHVRVPKATLSSRLSTSLHSVPPILLTIFALTGLVCFLLLTLLHLSSSSASTQRSAVAFAGYRASANKPTLPPYTYTPHSKASTSKKPNRPLLKSIWQGSKSVHSRPGPKSPFSGRFSRFPTMSQLPERHRRLTLIGVWSSGTFNEYLRQYMHSVQLNADAVDFVLINRLMNNRDKCIDFEANNVNISWGGNVNFVCMTDTEWKHRHVDFLCSSEHGWDCDNKQRLEVVVELTRREDPYNVDWKPLRGQIFRDLFPNPDNPMWAWHDLDSHIGRFTHFPFNILAGTSLVTLHWGVPGLAFLAGQFTAFNMDDPNLSTAWKRQDSLQSPEHFTQGLSGPHPEGQVDESFWSKAYLRSDVPGAGEVLSWVILPDFQFTEERFEAEGSWTNVVSGRDVLQVEKSLSREQVEWLMDMSRKEKVDDFGGVGWTSGVDSTQIREAEEALEAARNRSFVTGHFDVKVKAAELERLQRLPQHEGIVDAVTFTKGQVCESEWYLWFPHEYAQCVPKHPLTRTQPSLMRASLTRFRDAPPGVIHRRLERDARRRGYARKLFLHYHMLKLRKWFYMPSFTIDDSKIMQVDWSGLDVYNRGETRNRTIWHSQGDWNDVV